MYPKNGHVILHVDMNSFYASVEVALHPELKGKPLAVAGDPKKRHGVVVTSSYEARSEGVKTTMTVWEAKRACPRLVIIPPDFDRYRKASAAIFNLLRDYTDLVQPVSIDEGYLDISQCHHLGTPTQIAEQIQKRIHEELKLPCSIGVAPNKYLAKMASDMKKPLGITVLRKRDVASKLWPLDVGELHGIGKKTKEKLNRIGITTIGDLASADEGVLKKTMGVSGEKMKQRSHGIDSRPVDPDAGADFKSIGHSTTLPVDAKDEETVSPVLRRLAASVEKRMQRKGSVAFNIQLLIRYHDRRNITRNRQLNNPIAEADEIFQAAYLLWEKHWNGQPIRLLGITAQELMEKQEAYRQLDLFTYEDEAKREEHTETLNETLQQIRQKYGKEVIQQHNHEPHEQ